MIHILLVADGRSAITHSWLRMLKGLDCRVSLVSTFPCDPPENADLVEVLPVGFSTLAGGQVRFTVQKAKNGSWMREIISHFRTLLLGLRSWLAPLSLGSYQKHFARIAVELKPDLVHALRIPYEGMLAAVTPADIPLIVSIWGNDLTLHARTSPLMAAQTRRTLRRVDGLMADTARDIGLAKLWDLCEDIPTLVVPGSGGLDLKKISSGIHQKGLPFDIPAGKPLIINPRGFRPGSVHQETFFRSIPLVLDKIPDSFFVCTAMQGQRQAEKWVKDLGIRGSVLLLPYLPQEQLWQLYARSQVYVSLSSHDGTPNTFLEALACGCFPVAGDIASLREWIDDGVNGLLVDPLNSQAAASAIIRVIEDEKMRNAANKTNTKMIRDRAEKSGIQKHVFSYYQKIIHKSD